MVKLRDDGSVKAWLQRDGGGVKATDQGDGGCNSVEFVVDYVIKGCWCGGNWPGMAASKWYWSSLGGAGTVKER